MGNNPNPNKKLLPDHTIHKTIMHSVKGNIACIKRSLATWTHWLQGY